MNAMRMHKNKPENFAAGKQRKREKRTRFSPKKAKPGAFWVLEGMGTVANRCERIEKTGKLEGIRGTDLSRLPPRSGLDAAHRAAGPHDTHRRRATLLPSLSAH